MSYTNLVVTDVQLAALAALVFRVRMGGTSVYAKAMDQFILENEEALENSGWENIVIKFKKNDYEDRDIVIKN